jgi:predicted MFS family arabinose efflux permease
MSADPRRAYGLLLAMAMLAVGLDVGVARFTYGVVLPVFARDLQLSLTAAGLLGTSHLVGYLLGTLASPMLNARLGPLTLCRASQIVFAGAMLVCGLTSDLTVMAVARLVTGLGAGSGVFAVFLLVFSASTPAQRAKAGPLVWSGIGVAIIASGLAAGPILETGDWRSSFIVPAALALAGALLTPRTRVAAPTPAPTSGAPPSRWTALLSARWLFLFAAYFLFGAGYIAYATFAGVLLKEIGLSPRGVAGFWVMYGVASMIGAALGAMLLSRPTARRLALSAALGSAALGALLGVHGGVFAASILVGLGLVATPAIITFLIRSRTSDAAYPFFFTVGTAFLGAGQLISPTIGGALADWVGPSSIGWLAAGLYGAGMLAAAADGLAGRTPHALTD